MATINPFQAPINYSVDVQSPFEAALGGFKLGAAGAEAQVQAQAREQALKAQTELRTLFTNPNATAADFDRVSAFLPKDQAEGLRSISSRMTTTQQQGRLGDAGQVYSALKAGQPEIAKTLLQSQISAFRNSGREQDAKATETYLELIGINPVGAQSSIGLMMAMMPGGKEILENIDKTLSTGRTEALAPAAFTKAEADADKAVADAKTAQETATNAPEKAKADAARATADAAKAAIDAKFAERVAIAALEKTGADLGLTKAQTGSAIALTRKLGVETSKLALELEALKATGGVDPTKTFEKEEKLRKEYQGRIQQYSQLGTTYSNIQSSANAKTGQGDVALITQFMKMIDPGAVVRETDFAIARDTAGLYTKLENALKKAEGGQFLQPGQRNDFVNLAKQYYDAAQKKAGEDKKALGVVVKNYKLNPENVFGPEAEFVPPPSSTGMFAPAATGGTPAAAQRNVTVAY